MGGAAAAAFLSPLAARAASLASDPSRPLGPDASRLAWVWSFEADGHPFFVRQTLAKHGLGVLVKTHDGTDWMDGIGDDSGDGSAFENISRLADFFEAGGVPFHAWAVVTGEDPKREAEMASSVLNSGARSMVFDLESYDGFWVGDDSDAKTFGHELRKRQPAARLATTVDARPWEIDNIPLPQFASFSNVILPQTYWGMFTSDANVDEYRGAGYEPPHGRVTPTFVVDTAVKHLSRFSRPVAPIGDGSVSKNAEWAEFLEACATHKADGVSVWRFGVTAPQVFTMLQDGAFSLPASPVNPAHPLLKNMPPRGGASGTSGGASGW